MNSKRIFLFVACFVGSVFATSFFFSYIVFQGSISFDIESSVYDKLQVFWGNENNNYTEKDSRIIVLKDSRQHISISIPDLSRIKHIRFDPNTTESIVRIYDITLKQKWIDPIFFNSIDTFKTIIPINDIGTFDIYSDHVALTVVGSDPQLETVINANVYIYRSIIYWLSVIINTVLIVMIIAWCMNICKWNYVVWMLEMSLVVFCVYMFFIYYGKQFHFSTLFVKELFNEFIVN